MKFNFYFYEVINIMLYIHNINKHILSLISLELATASKVGFCLSVYAISWVFGQWLFQVAISDMQRDWAAFLCWILEFLSCSSLYSISYVLDYLSPIVLYLLSLLYIYIFFSISIFKKWHHWVEYTKIWPIIRSQLANYASATVPLS